MPVQVKVDEDLPGEIARLCEAAGYPAETVYGQGHSVCPMTNYGPLYNKKGDSFLRQIRDLLMLESIHRDSHEGIVLFRLPRESRSGYLRLTEYLLGQVKLGDISRAIVVVSPDAIRVLRE